MSSIVKNIVRFIVLILFQERNFTSKTNLKKRENLLKIVNQMKNIEFGQMDFTNHGRIRYLQNLRENSFVLCPEGNGIDTHRLWETLYRGAIPLVRESSWLENFEFLASVTLKVSSWNLEEILTTVENRKVKFFNPHDVPELWWPYCERLIFKL